MFEIELIICIKMDLTLNNLRRLIYHRTQKNKKKNKKNKNKTKKNHVITQFKSSISNNKYFVCTQF